ncbi:MAG TPA: triose-phosphate isomerase [Candidatus Methylomirabilis sp.]|nr:triose-phosphate isomerase [Candidatus Methylomirabilis sp.]
MRVPVIAGNWKMYKTAGEAAAFVRAFRPLVSAVRGVEIVLAPPYPSIAAVAELVRGSGIGVASQNVHFADEGAFTGEVSPRMVADAGATHCIIGHSERRQYYAEDDDAVNRKVRATLAAGLTPILCVGETLPEREDGKTFDVVGRQIAGGSKEIVAADGPRVIVAYEPVWAIGTGKTATPDQAQEVHAFLRDRLKALWGRAADSVRILYGGSVKPDNIAALMANRDIDGALVGGASLSPESFAKIVTFH